MPATVCQRLPMPIRRRTVWLGLMLTSAVAGCGTTRGATPRHRHRADAHVRCHRPVDQPDRFRTAQWPRRLSRRQVHRRPGRREVRDEHVRQHLFASGCLVKDRADDASCVVEVRAGALGTNRNDLLWGVPATNLPSGGGMLPLVPTSIPELSLMKKTAQQGVCKVAVFAYDRASGRPIWQSGVRQQVSKAKDIWVFGTGPFQRGTIYDGTKFAGEHLQVPLAGDSKSTRRDNVWVTHEIQFHEPPQVVGVPPVRTPTVAAADNSTGGSTSPDTAGGSAPAGATAFAPNAAPGNSGSSPSAAGSQQTSSATPNAAAGAYGAVQAVDWARTVRQNYNTGASGRASRCSKAELEMPSAIESLQRGRSILPRAIARYPRSPIGSRTAGPTAHLSTALLPGSSGSPGIPSSALILSASAASYRFAPSGTRCRPLRIGR